MEQGKRTTAHSVCLQVGIGEQGALSHMYGLKFDHIVDMDADGSIVQASTTKNPDLSWVMICTSYIAAGSLGALRC